MIRSLALKLGSSLQSLFFEALTDLLGKYGVAADESALDQMWRELILTRRDHPSTPASPTRHRSLPRSELRSLAVHVPPIHQQAFKALAMLRGATSDELMAEAVVDVMTKRGAVVSDQGSGITSRCGQAMQRAGSCVQ